MCGKDSASTNIAYKATGSPPHVRERLLDEFYRDILEWITPACAGKTNVVELPSSLFKDHPRMCGKDSCCNGPGIPLSGSPPHVRERPGVPALHSCRSRITPACAGKTSSTSSTGLPSGDHPRMCGKDMIFGARAIFSRGSPPHVRERQ